MESKPSASAVPTLPLPELPSENVEEVDHCGQATHKVLNQSSPFSNFNAFADVALRSGVAMHGGLWGFQALEQLGAKVGSEEWQQKATDANRQVPRLENFDRFGQRRDAVAFHPAYHELMELGLSSGAAAFAWQNFRRPGAHVIRGALMHLMYQLDQGVCCPITMTFAAIPALDMAMVDRSKSETAEFLRSFREKLTSGKYCDKDVPISSKDGATCGMSMTEKQGGSDVRANMTEAKPVVPGKAAAGDAFWLVGHKWFTSAPMSDAFLTLAQSKEGVSCFVVPRWRPDGRKNAGFNVQRLKEKIGDKSNASSEVEYRNAWGVMIGEPGRGVRTIVEMVVHTRLDCVIGSSALMRLSAQLAFHHATERWAFGRPLIQQRLMRHVLADLTLESEAAMATWLRLARALDQREADLARIATAISKYYVCKRSPLVAYEAMECHGGNGYVDDSPIARLFRQAPLNAIWEGSGNVICLDILRALRKEPETASAILAELQRASELLSSSQRAGEVGRGYLNTIEHIKVALSDPMDSNFGRESADQLAISFQASCLLQYGDPLVAEAFLATRWTQLGLTTQSLGSATSSLPESLIDHLLERLRMSPSPRL